MTVLSLDGSTFGARQGRFVHWILLYPGPAPEVFRRALPYAFHDPVPDPFLPPGFSMRSLRRAYPARGVLRNHLETSVIDAVVGDATRVRGHGHRIRDGLITFRGVGPQVAHMPSAEWRSWIRHQGTSPSSSRTFAATTIGRISIGCACERFPQRRTPCQAQNMGGLHARHPPRYHLAIPEAVAPDRAPLRRARRTGRRLG